jgi:uncharacterized membrane protein|tara:strand:+ start:1141 stop:1371 length:231 start_codon:yes stop_codon:yes gene_type:complete
VNLTRGFLLLISLSAAFNAYGYIDPGTGSLIIQSVIGAIAAIGVTVKIYWHKLRLLFSKRRPSTDEDTKLEDKPPE